MDIVCDAKINVTDSQRNSTSAQQFNDDDVWQDLIGIALDPPDHRKKCDKCQ